MPLLQSQKNRLNYFASTGDVEAKAILEATQTGVEKIIALVNPAAKAANNVAVTSYGDEVTHPITVAAGAAAILAATPRNLRCTFGAAWDGGTITITGTDQFGVPQTEVIAGTAGQVVVGTKVWKTVTALAKSAVGVGSHATNTVTVGTGDKLGCGTVRVANPFGQLITDGVYEAVVIDPVASGFTPTTVPDGAHDYQLLVRSVA
jgi:hypothetical protein